MVSTAPYGTWASTISSRTVAEQGLRLSFVAIDGDDIYWLEGRPGEDGRNVLVRCRPDGSIADVTPPGHNVRTRVQEYGGGAFVVADGAIYYSNYSDQRIYRIVGELRAEPVTLDGPWFYADAVVDRRHRRLICVREDHSREGHEPGTTLVVVPLDRPVGEATSTVLTAGADFYSTPRLSPDGTKLAWLSWRHPQMPWDGTELWVASFTAAGELRDPIRVAGSATESIYQPGWSPQGALYFSSDRTGWWQLYRAPLDAAACSADVVVEPVLGTPLDETEFGRPQWLFGWATCAFADSTRLVATYARRGRWALAAIDLRSRTIADIATSLEPLESLAATRTHAVLVAASPTTPYAVVRIDLASGDREVLRSSTALTLDPDDISVPEAIEFPTERGLTAHAFYYPPRNRHVVALPSERPPLIAISHGGPSTQAKAMLDLQVQYWTSRGFAVVDVNYGGSSGYGRAYRERLNGQWGVVDVDDVINAARYLIEQGRADPLRLIIRGGSAGGYTTFAALAFHPEVFKAGAGYYGVSDVEALAKDTHKFESRYLDTLIGPYPADQALYRARSPIHFVDRLSCALILFQGLEDKVVPPDQSQRMADAVREKGLPVAYLSFAGEQHGFRRSDTIVRCLDAELYFYGAVFGFTPSDSLAPIAIHNLALNG